jgi:hypothetical protein
MWPHPTSRGSLRTVANPASLELSELLLISAKGCGSEQVSSPQLRRISFRFRRCPLSPNL